MSGIISQNRMREIPGLAEVLASKQENTVTQLKSVALQRETLTKNTWNTVATIPGAGILTRFWVGFGTTPEDAFVARNTLVRITANGAGIAQVGGSTDVTMEDFFCSGLGGTGVFRSERVGVSKNTIGQFSGHLKQMMPFSNGLVIQLKPPSGGSSAVFFYAMFDYAVGNFSDGLLDGSWVFHADTISDGINLSESEEQTLLDTNTETLFLGIRHSFDPTQASHNYLECDYLISDDGGLSNFWTASGTEDMFGGSFFFAGEPAYQNSECGVTIRPTDAETLHKTAAYRFFDSYAMPYGENGLLIKWGFEDLAPFLGIENVDSRATVFYYMRS